MNRLATAVLLAALWAASTVPVRGDDAFTEPDSGSYFGYSTHPPRVIDLASEQVETNFVSPEVVEVLPPEPSGPLGRPDADAGLLPTVPSPTFARPYRAAPVEEPWDWHLLPGDTMFKSFLAGTHAQRMAGEVVESDKQGTLLDTTIGGRIALLRKGTVGPNPEGWELQVVGAAFTRLAPDRESDVEAVDFNFALPVVYRQGPTAYRFGYDHISSHLGDEFLIKNPGYDRLNYVRDSMVFAVVHDLSDSVDVYGEANYAFHNTGGSEPWHFQFGAEYQPEPVPGWRGAPVAAINTLLREEFGYEGNLGLIAGWQWRGLQRDDALRLALTYYTGRSRQFSFYDLYETLAGVGLYYDF